jgi:fluoride exporter
MNLISISFSSFLYVFIGGGIGATLRWLFYYAISPLSARLWISTFFVNILGCLLIYTVSRSTISNIKEIQLLVKIGLIGSLTTFSTLSFEIVGLLKSGNYLEALIVLFLNLFFGIATGILII